MTIASMTGFARADGGSADAAWHWELRSVNGRGLDLRVRLAPGADALEPKVREALGKAFTRGSVSVNLFLARSRAVTSVRLNEAVLADVLAAAEALRAKGIAPPTADGLLAVRGVLDVVEAAESEADAEARSSAMLASLDVAIKGLAAARAEEGARLKAVIEAQVAEVERLVALVAASPARTPEAMRARLKEQVARLLDAASAFDETRLHQEAALLATRADVEEEIKRLASHVAQARELLAQKGAVGRRLDFLTQEFNREANTLCAKANDPDITRAGLELKAVIDQMREQVQNIE